MMLLRHLQALGWTFSEDCGSIFYVPRELESGMHRGGVFCHVWAGWEPYVGDTTYISTGAYWVNIDCVVDDPNICTEDIQM